MGKRLLQKGSNPDGEKMQLHPQRRKQVRVLHILMELRPSGAEVMLRIAAPLWFADGSSHSILATGAKEGLYADALREAGFTVFHIPFCKKLQFFYDVFSFIRRGRFAAVHIHTEQANVYYGIAARLAGVRTLVHTIHNVFPFTGSLRLVRMAMRKGLQFLGATAVAVGESVAENERNHLRNPAIVIPNWYDTNVFRPPSAEERKTARETYGITQDKQVLVTLGNCNEWKNHRLLFEALKLLVRTGNNWLYLHAGAEDEGRSEHRLATELGIPEHCVFLGLVATPRSVLWAADVFVMPSLREGMSLAAVEAAACGLPLVLTDVPGLRDLKTIMSDSMWVPLEPAALADAIETMHARFPHGSQRNPSSAQEAFGIKIGAQAYAALYAGFRPSLAARS